MDVCPDSLGGSMKNARKKAPQDKNALMNQHLECEIAGDGKTVQTKTGRFIAYCGSPEIARKLLALLNSRAAA
jgi:hypothetical protein